MIPIAISLQYKENFIIVDSCFSSKCFLLTQLAF